MNMEIDPIRVYGKKNSDGEKKTPDALVVLGMIVLVVLVIAVVVALAGLLVRWLWNHLMPGVFNLPTLSYWQAIGLFVLAQLFFGAGAKVETGNKTVKKTAKQELEQKPDNDADPTESDKYQDWWKNEGKQAFDLYKTKKSGPEIVDFED